MSAVQGPSRTSWVLLFISLVTLVGHVCALPAHGEASREPAGHRHAHPAPPPDGHGEADSVHAASCDAVKTAAPTFAAPTMIVAHVVSGREMRPPARRFVQRAVATAPPPLFLLHAALLI